jgi:UDP-N-acetylmuramoyl-tripeptide--D-alanyl-D-alanine ligase
MDDTGLTRLLEGVDIQYVSDRKAFQAASVRTISTDSRSLKEGELFVAIPGERFDGHDFIPDALERGCAGVLFEMRRGAGLRTLEERQARFERPRAVMVGVRDSRRAFGAMARNYLRGFAIPRITVTGSVGKTSTTGMIRDVLGRAFRVVASPESYNNDIGVPKTIFGVDGSTELLVQEIGTNHPGEIANLTGLVEPDRALITDVGPSHLEFFGDERSVAREKKDAILTLPAEGTAFLNADGGFYRYLRRGIRAKVKSFGIERGDLHPEKILRIGFASTEFLLMGERVTIPFPGLHSVVNAVSAILVALDMGLDLREAARGLEEARPRSGRGVVHRLASGAALIDESYNANPLSVSASLSYLGSLPTEGRRIFVFGDMLELGEKAGEYHRRIADQAHEKGVDVLLTTGEQAAETSRRYGSRGYGIAYHEEGVEGLIDRLRSLTGRDDIVLVKASRKLMLERVVDALQRHER